MGDDFLKKIKGIRRTFVVRSKEGPRAAAAAMGMVAARSQTAGPYFRVSGDVYADRSYHSIERETRLKQAGWRVRIQRRGHATKGISQTQKRRNRAIATPRARGEHVFGSLAQMGGKLVRCLGIVRTTFVLQLKAASYNLRRLVSLKERGRATF